MVNDYDFILANNMPPGISFSAMQTVRNLTISSYSKEFKKCEKGEKKNVFSIKGLFGKRK